MCGNAGVANAERTLNTLTTSYDRNVPRMQSSFLYLQSLEPMLIDLSTPSPMSSIPTSPDAPEIQSIINNLDAERGSDISIMLGTMRILSTSFSDSVISKTTRELQLATLKVKESLSLMSLDLKQSNYPEALHHYNEALYYIDIYVGVANAALPMNMKIKGPKGETVRRRDEDVVKSEGSF
ncbi:hypothetical protein TrLO_g8358 [Triparma laevis f. longispina]|uniref:Uncharacterized protein n=1 Tax=Triparma laevis f. longispina TaxID=1714387 RepID=A0A9W7DQT5_9STRA|nr:hypothetical protein TrLO_g8358 [Triparma laevis f. longispina]